MPQNSDYDFIDHINPFSPLPSLLFKIPDSLPSIPASNHSAVSAHGHAGSVQTATLLLASLLLASSSPSFTASSCLLQHTHTNPFIIWLYSFPLLGSIFWILFFFFFLLPWELPPHSVCYQYSPSSHAFPSQIFSWLLPRYCSSTLNTFLLIAVPTLHGLVIFQRLSRSLFLAQCPLDGFIDSTSQNAFPI